MTIYGFVRAYYPAISITELAVFLRELKINNVLVSEISFRKMCLLAKFLQIDVSELAEVLEYSLKEMAYQSQAKRIQNESSY